MDCATGPSAASTALQPTLVSATGADERPPVAGPSKPAKTRSRTGCMTCRRRKHKCGEERLGPPSRPSCERCRAAGLECIWPTADQMPKGRAPRPYRPKASVGPTRERRPLSSSGGSEPRDLYEERRPKQASVIWPMQAGQAIPHLPSPPVLASLSADAGSTVPVPPNPSAESLDLDTTSAAATLQSYLPDHAPVLGSKALWPPSASVGPSTSQAYPQRSQNLNSTASSLLETDLFDQARVWELGQVGSDAFGDFGFSPADGTYSTAGGARDDPSLPPSPGSAWLFDLPPSPLRLLNSPLLPSNACPDSSQLDSGFATSLLDGSTDDDQYALWRGPDENQRHPSQSLQGASGLPRYVTPTPMLEVLFKNPEERSLIQHFLFQIPVVFIGRPQSAQGTLAVPPAFLTGCEQPDMRSMMPYLDIGQFLALPRGESTAGDALSMAVMSVAAGHLAHLHHTAGLQALLAGDEAAVSRTAASEARYRAVGRSMANTSLSLVRSSLDLAQLHLPGGAEVGVSGDRSDDDAVAHVETMTRLLVACSFAVLTDCISGGHEHQKGLTLAKEAVVGAGGARRMLSTLAASLSPTNSYASPFAAARRRRLRLLRSVLEELTSWDLVTSLTTGTAPTAFAAAPASLSDVTVAPDGDASASTESLQDWLFAFSPPSGSHDMSDTDWETVETSWGTSRAVMELFARVNALCSATRSSLQRGEVEASAGRALVEIGIRKADILRAFPELSRSPFPPFDAPVMTEDSAEDYRRRVKFGKLGPHDGFGSLVDQRRARRLVFGDLLWCLTFEIMLRTDVLGEDPASASLQALAERIIDLVIESHARKQVQVGLAWPTVIAGATMRNPASRARVHTALESFASYTLFELDHATQLLTEIWALRDAGNTWTTWRDIAGREGGFALV